MQRSLGQLPYRPLHRAAWCSRTLPPETCSCHLYPLLPWPHGSRAPKQSSCPSHLDILRGIHVSVPGCWQVPDTRLEPVPPGATSSPWLSPREPGTESFHSSWKTFVFLKPSLFQTQPGPPLTTHRMGQVAGKRNRQPNYDAGSYPGTSLCQPMSNQCDATLGHRHPVTGLRWCPFRHWGQVRLPKCVFHCTGKL